MTRVCALFCAAALLFGGCSGGERGVPVSVYYASQGYKGGAALPETRYFAGEGDIMLFALREMARAPEDSGRKSVFGESFAPGGVTVDGDVAIAEIAGDYASLSGAARVAFNYALFLTLTQFEGVAGVCVDGGGELSPVMREGDFLSRAPGIVPSQQDILLYFATAQGEIASETRRVVLRESESAEWYRYVMEGLIAGPVSSRLLPVMPPGTRLLSVGADNKVCGVNLSGEFVTASDGDYQNARLTLLAIVNSLTQFPGVSFVRLRVDGEDLLAYCGHDLTAPLQSGAEP
ncbi:MAG: GerMN domain-containing protein [Oscillospiraceae bacterium]|jgi:germination protein M|nr:GerMN domain-containing protein [Oscillospiraceae bacterium]